MKRAAGFLIALLVVSAIAGVSPARSEEAGEAEGGIPAYAVARVKVLDGSVWVRPSDGGEWEEYASNSPLPPRSRVSVPEGSEAELQFHGGQFVLLTSGTDLEVRDLLEGKSVFRLRAGEIRFDLPPDDFAPVSVRVPGGALARFPEPGRQWLTVTEDEETRLVVRRGRAVVTLDGDEHPLRAGQEAVIGQDITVGEYRGGEDDTASAPPPPEPQGDAPPAVVNELRDYGEWITVPTYGQVWRPRVAVGWSPYVYGRWSWISPYGWTWVSNEPWGWYPYRCGYWLSDPVFGWFWSPYNSFVSVDFVFGSHRYRHHNAFYRPATVRFIPEGRNVRWVPLRPGERFRAAEFRRGDTRLSQWNRPLDTGRVFVRGGPDRREWRDYHAVRAERQVELRKTRAAQPRLDTRRVRPESRDSRAPFAVERKRSTEPRNSEKAVRDRGNRLAPREGRGIERRPATPSGRPARDSEGKAVRESSPPRVPPSRAVVRPEGNRGVVQERAPAVRTPDAGSRGREFREE
ncbi:MAG TPA: DUF6600 domain-containing protein, partial [Candidatus Methylomirabilis sp.]|nr:DUF6600 domain-containing protein [Candidatus Methylomirabilis sp.]